MCLTKIITEPDEIKSLYNVDKTKPVFAWKAFTLYENSFYTTKNSYERIIPINEWIHHQDRVERSEVHYDFKGLILSGKLETKFTYTNGFHVFLNENSVDKYVSKINSVYGPEFNEDINIICVKKYVEIDSIHTFGLQGKHLVMICKRMRILP